MTIYARRHNPRFRLNEAAYIQLEPENSASVVDICEAGLRFKASSPLLYARSFKFRLASGNSEATADLMWIDDSRTTGGVRFKILPSEILAQIRVWIDESRDFEGLPRKAPPASTVVTIADRISPSALSPTAPEAEPKLHQASADLASEITQGLNVSPAPGAISGSRTRSLPIFPSAATALSEQQTGSRPSSSGRRLALAALFVLIFFGAASAAAGHYYPKQTYGALSRAQSIVERVVSLARQRTQALRQAVALLPMRST